MNKNEIFIQKRLIDLSNQAFRQDRVVFSDFLGLNEQNILHTTDKTLFAANFNLFGGTEAERKILAFYPHDFNFGNNYPIKIILITKKYPKFAEKLSHRDFLGSLMGIGITREKIGDIIVGADKTYVYVKDEAVRIIIDNLDMVRKTAVNLTVLDKLEEIENLVKYEVIKGNVASVRLDSIIGEGLKVSRSSAVGLISKGVVFVNGKLITSNGYSLLDGDIISVRGFGRLKYCGVVSTTKKSRYVVEIHRYI